MASGEWRMMKGEWRMMNDEWRVVNDEGRVAIYNSTHELLQQLKQLQQLQPFGMMIGEWRTAIVVSALEIPRRCASLGMTGIRMLFEGSTINFGEDQFHAKH